MKKRVNREDGSFREIEQYLKKHGQDSQKFRKFMHQVYHDEHSSDEEEEKHHHQHSEAADDKKTQSTNNKHMVKAALGQHVSENRHTPFLLRKEAEETKRNEEETLPHHPRNLDDAVEQLQNELTEEYMEELTQKFGENYDVHTLRTLLELNSFKLEKTINQLSSMRRFEITKLIQTEYMKKIKEFEAQINLYDSNDDQNFEIFGTSLERRGLDPETMENALFSEQDSIKLDHGPRILLKEPPKKQPLTDKTTPQKQTRKNSHEPSSSSNDNQTEQAKTHSNDNENEDQLVEEVVEALKESPFDMFSDDLFVHAFLYLDPQSLARCAQVCTVMNQLAQKQCYYKRFSLMTWTDNPTLPEFSVLPNNFRQIWGDINALYKVDRKYLKSFGSWKAMYTQRPHLRLRGCYVAKAQYTRTGARDVLTHHSDAPVVHLVTYWRYIRFLKDGSAMVYTTERKPSKALKHMGYENLSHFKGNFGEYVVHNDTVFVKVSMHDSLYEYEFRVGGFTPGANNELNLLFYGVRSTTEDDSLELPLQTGYPRHFRFYDVEEFENDSFFHAVI